MRFVAVVDGKCYGFFQSATDAVEWVKENFPVAYTQFVWNVYIFDEVIKVTA